MLWIGDFCLQIKFLIISSLVDRIDRNASFLSFWPWFIRFITNFLANLYVRRYFWCIEQSWRSKTLDRNNITSCSSSAMAVADCFRAVWLERTSQNRKAHSYDPHEHSSSLLFLGGHGLICTLALCLFLWNHGHFFYLNFKFIITFVLLFHLKFDRRMSIILKYFQVLTQARFQLEN